MKINRVENQGTVNLKKAINDLNKTLTKVGWFSNARYEKGMPAAYVAAIQEFGDITKNIPPRPFMRPAIKKNEKGWTRIIKDYGKRILEGRSTVDILMWTLGSKVSGQIREEITLVTEPPLKRSTIEARKRKLKKGKKIASLGIEKPLVESAYLLDSVTYIVENK